MITPVQVIRLIDVFAIGPFLLWVANAHLTGFPAFVVALIGVATIWYNGVRYLDEVR